VLADGAVLAAHYAGAYNRTAMNTFIAAVSVDMFPGGRLQAAVAIGRRTAIHATFFVGIMLMKAVDAFGTARPEFTGFAIDAFRHTIPLCTILVVFQNDTLETAHLL
jgi:hypothetical protein